MWIRRAGDWTVRLLKGTLIGTGAILPGVSGGALAAVFGLYRRMIAFLADPRRGFWGNFRFFLPVGMGGALGVFLLSFGVSWMLERAEAQILWFFVGCIAGTLPSLWRQAGAHGRKPRHLMLMACTFALVFLLLSMGEGNLANMPQNTATWLLCGAIIGLGAIVPGLSPSNLLVCFGMYKAMTDGIQALNPAILLPLLLGAAGSVLIFSKGVNLLFQRAYGELFHGILGALLASTALIMPLEARYGVGGVAVSLLDGLLGLALGLWMSRLEERKEEPAAHL